MPVKLVEPVARPLRVDRTSSTPVTSYLVALAYALALLVVTIAASRYVGEPLPPSTYVAP